MSILVVACVAFADLVMPLFKMFESNKDSGKLYKMKVGKGKVIKVIFMLYFYLTLSNLCFECYIACPAGSFYFLDLPFDHFVAVPLL